MKNKILFTLVSLALVCLLPACNGTIYGGPGSQSVRGSGTASTENRSVSNVTGVDLGTPGTLDITIGTNDSLIVEADDNLLQYIQTDVRGGILEINTQPGITMQLVVPIKYHLTVTRLNSLGISSSGDITAPDLKTNDFSISISSSGNLSMAKLDCSSLQVRISSSGDARISALNAKTISVDISSSGNLDILGGSVPRQTVSIGSSGQYSARNLASESANVNLSSSGDATLQVSTSLTGSLSSSGDINYVGNPIVNVSTSSSGRTNQIH
jgi:hypothetical protein